VNHTCTKETYKYESKSAKETYIYVFSQRQRGKICVFEKIWLFIVSHSCTKETYKYEYDSAKETYMSTKEMHVFEKRSASRVSQKEFSVHIHRSLS